MATVLPRSKKRKTSNEVSAGPSGGASASQSASVGRNNRGVQSVNEVIGGKVSNNRLARVSGSKELDSYGNISSEIDRRRAESLGQRRG